MAETNRMIGEVTFVPIGNHTGKFHGGVTYRMSFLTTQLFVLVQNVRTSFSNLRYLKS